MKPASNTARMGRFRIALRRDFNQDKTISYATLEEYQGKAMNPVVLCQLPVQ